MVAGLTEWQERVLAVLREHPNEAFDARCLGMLVFDLARPWDGGNDTHRILYVLRQLERKGLVWRDSLRMGPMGLVIAALNGTEALRNGTLTIRIVEFERRRPVPERLKAWTD